MAGYLGGMLVVLGAVPFLIRHLGVADFGRYATVISLGTVVASVTDAGLTALGVREYSVRDEAQRRGLMRDLLGARIALSVIGALAATAFAVVAGYDHTMVLGTLAIGGGVVLSALQTTLTVPLVSGLRMGLVTAIEFLRQAVTAALLLGAVLLGTGLLTFFLVPIPAAAITLVVLVPIVARVAPILPSLDVSAWWRLLRQILSFAAASALNVVYYRIAIVVMSLLATEQATGFFSASFRVMEVLLLLPGLTVSAAFPILARAARDDSERLRYTVQRMFEVALIAGTGVALALVAGAPAIVAVLGGADFAPAAGVLQIQAPAIVATFLLATWGHALLAMDCQRQLLVANAGALGAILVLSIALIPAAGASGAAVSTTVVEVGLAAAYAVALARHMPSLRPSLGIVGPVALAAAVALAPVILGAPTVLAVASAVLVYLGILVALGAIPREVADALMRRP